MKEPYGRVQMKIIFNVYGNKSYSLCHDEKITCFLMTCASKSITLNKIMYCKKYPTI